MGMDRTVTFLPGQAPAFETVRDFLAARGYLVQLRMIDGQLAFPDELLPEGWQEVRLGTPDGMVTLRRAGDTFTFVTWGNAEAGLRQAWNALAWAAAHLGNGSINGDDGPLGADAFQARTELPSCLRPNDHSK